MNIHRVIPVNGPDEVEVVWEQPRAEDSDGVVMITRQSAFPGQTFRVNTQTSILYEFSDQEGNLARCSFMVVVIKGGECYNYLVRISAKEVGLDCNSLAKTWNRTSLDL